MRKKIPIPLLIAGIFLVVVAIYLTFIVNTSAPPVWTSASNTTLTFVTPQTYFIYGTEFNRIVDGKSLATVSVLGSRLASIAVSNTQSVPWFIVGESMFTGTISLTYSDTYTFSLPMLLAMAYNESQIASKYGTNTICVTINGTSVTLVVNPTNAPGYIALGYYLTGASGDSWGIEAEYYYIGKAVAPSGFTWYLYLAAPLAGAATGKISISNVGCTESSNNLYFPLGTLYSISTSGYLPQITVQLATDVPQYVTFSAKQVANMTSSTTAAHAPAGDASTIYGPDGSTVGIALPLESYAFPVQSSVQVTYYP